MLQLGNLVIRQPGAASPLMGRGEGKEKAGVVLTTEPLTIASLDAQTFWNDQDARGYMAVGVVWRGLLTACQKNWYTTQHGRLYLHAKTKETP